MAGQQATTCDAAAVVRHRIVSGIIGVDEPWSFVRLADEIRSDVATAKAAVHELAREGFIDVAPEGFRVNSGAGSPSDEVLELRLLVEPVAVRQAAAHVRVADLIALREVVDAVGEASRRRDFDDYNEAVADLYGIMLRLVPNRQLAELVQDLRVRTRTEGARQLVEAGLMTNAEWPYAKLLEAVEARDGDAVGTLVATSLRNLRYLGAALPGASSGYSAHAEPYPDDLVPFEVDDHVDTGW